MKREPVRPVVLTVCPDPADAQDAHEVAARRAGAEHWMVRSAPQPVTETPSVPDPRRLIRLVSPSEGRQLERAFVEAFRRGAPWVAAVWPAAGGASAEDLAQLDCALSDCGVVLARGLEPHAESCRLLGVTRQPAELLRALRWAVGPPYATLRARALDAGDAVYSLPSPAPGPA